jgi:hypothetical protein
MSCKASFTATADETSVGAEWIVLALLAALRAGTLALGAAEIAASSSLTQPITDVAVLAALAAESAGVFALAARRLRAKETPALAKSVPLFETATGVAGLVLVAGATPLTLRSTSSFWIEPYTVITALMLAASTRHVSIGALGVVALTATYLLCTLALVPRGTRVSTDEEATALANAISYLPFFAVGEIGFALLRSVVGQTDRLRALLRHLSSERARVRAAKEAYDVGHDIPKAVLRVVRRRGTQVEQVRPVVARYRADLASRIGAEPSVPAGLREQLSSYARTFATSLELCLELEGLNGEPPGRPTTFTEAVRELLNNAWFHASGYPVRLTARSSEQRVEVEVENGGSSIDPLAMASEWSRKQNTIHQLYAAGGDYLIRSPAGPAGGTVVTVMWPGGPGAEG